MKKILISIDNGNKQTKGLNVKENQNIVYDSGFITSKDEPILSYRNTEVTVCDLGGFTVDCVKVNKNGTN